MDLYRVFLAGSRNHCYALRYAPLVVMVGLGLAASTAGAESAKVQAIPVQLAPVQTDSPQQLIIKLNDSLFRGSGGTAPSNHAMVARLRISLIASRIGTQLAWSRTLPNGAEVVTLQGQRSPAALAALIEQLSKADDGIESVATTQVPPTGAGVAASIM
jgi:hypothetical protein